MPLLPLYGTHHGEWQRWISTKQWQVRLVHQESSRSVLSYYSGAAAGYTPITSSGNQKLAIRFTPTTSGKLTSVAVNINGGASAIKGTGNLKVTTFNSITGSVGYIPGSTQIGSSVLVPFSSLSPGVANVIDFSSASVTVTAGIDFQVVLEILIAATHFKSRLIIMHHQISSVLHHIE